MYLPHKHYHLRYYGSKCTTAYTPAQTEYEQRIENNVDNYGHNSCRHRFHRLPRGSYYSIEAEIDMSNDRTRYYYLHKIVCVG